MDRGIITISENGAVAMPTVPVWMTQQEMSDAFNVSYTRTWSCRKKKRCDMSERTAGFAMTCTALKWW